MTSAAVQASVPPAPLPEVAILQSRGALAFARDLVLLTKPRLSMLVLFTTACGMYLAPGHIGAARGALTLVATMLVVAGAQTLNCWHERDVDAKMVRTRLRPLPDGRVEPRVALAQGLALSGLSVPALTFGVNALTGLLAVIALLTYVLVYTPLKRRTPEALYVGAIPGAIPPLLGWTAVTGSVDAGGVALFWILFAWQLPHFLAIAIYLREDYARGGIRAVPVVRGELAAKLTAVATSAVLVPITLVPVPLGLAGTPYLVAAGVLGAAFVGMSVTGLAGRATVPWARRFFVLSIVYLTLLLAALLVFHR